MGLQFPRVDAFSLERYAPLLGEERMDWVRSRTAELSRALLGRVVWNVSSTSVGGGVAEMVRTLLAYARGAGVDARWVVIEGAPDFFRLTKRIHHALHGSRGDGTPLDESARRLYEQVSQQNLVALADMVRPDDVVIVHDPQPAGVIAGLVRRGARVIWRCHIGHDEHNAETELGWWFLAPYVAPAAAYVFTRLAYAPLTLDPSRVVIITPSVDPFSAKNQWLDEVCVRAILERSGLVEGGTVTCKSMFTREDGTPGRVDRTAFVVREGGPLAWDAKVIVQVSRWDPLKDPLGVMAAFQYIYPTVAGGLHLMLAGPDVRAVADDPEGAAVFAKVVETWRELPRHLRERILLVSLPTDDVDENAAMVNAIQRHATVVVQKSLQEGFGLTVAEALWKRRPVVASAVGGILDQIEDGVSGLLLRDPRDPREFAAKVERVANDPELARRLGEAGAARVRDHFLGVDSILRYGALIEALDRAAQTAAVPSV